MQYNQQLCMLAARQILSKGTLPTSPKVRRCFAVLSLLRFLALAMAATDLAELEGLVKAAIGWRSQYVYHFFP